MLGSPSSIYGGAMETTPQNPVVVKWKQVAADLAVLDRRIDSLSKKRDQLAKKEEMLRGALIEAEIELPDLDRISQSRRRVARSTLEDTILDLVAPGEQVDANEIKHRAERAGHDVSSRNAGAAIRSAMRRSDSFVFVRRGIFKRKDGGVNARESSEAPSPTRENGASI